MSGLEFGWGLEVILWFQSWRTPLVETLGLVFAFLGSEDFYVVMLPLVYWCIDAAFGRRLGTVVLLSLWANSWLKGWAKRPRPYMVSSEVQPSTTLSSSYGIPSGHAQGTVTFWGVAAAKVRERWLTIAVIVYALLMALSRMVLGVHYPQDVIGGLVLGVLFVAGYMWLEPTITEWVSKRTLLEQIGIVVGATALLMLVHPGLVRVSAPQWVTELIPLEELLSGPITPLATFLGFSVGYALENRYVQFSAKGVWWKRVVRFLLGIAVLAGLRSGLDALFEGLTPPLVFRMIRYTIVGLWAGFGAPWVFVKIRLADRRVAVEA